MKSLNVFWTFDLPLYYFLCSNLILELVDGFFISNQNFQNEEEMVPIVPKYAFDLVDVAWNANNFFGLYDFPEGNDFLSISARRSMAGMSALSSSWSMAEGGFLPW